MCFMGILPFGALTAGWVSHSIGVPETVALGGTLCIVSGMIAYLVFRNGLKPSASLRVLAEKKGD